MSLPREHGKFKWMNNFKAFAVDYEYYLTLSDKPQSICLTERQMYVLSVQNSYTYWLTRWYNTDDITQKTVQFIAAEIDGLLVMCNCGVPALTPTDVFNTINYVNNTSTIYQNTQNAWYEGDQTVYSIAPALDFDTGDPINISKMVCAAIELLIRSLLAQGQTMNTQTAQQNTDILNVISSAMGGLATAGGIAALIEGLGAAAVAYFGGPWMLLGLALGAVGVKIASLFMGADNSLFENEAAIANVICEAQKNLNNKQVDRAAFAAALTPFAYGPGTPEAQIAALIQPFLDDLDTYLQFMVAGNGLYSKANFALMPDCGCANNCVHIDAAHDLEMLFTPSGGIGPQATWNGTGWAANTAVISSRITLQADLLAPLNIHSIRIVFSGTNAVGGINEVTMFTEDFGSVLSSVEFEEESILVPDVIIQKFEIDVVSSFDTSVPITVYITDMYIEYLGSAPTWGEPC